MDVLVGVFEGVNVAVAVAVGVLLGVRVSVGVFEGVNVAVAVFVGVSVAVEICVAVFVGIAIRKCSGRGGNYNLAPASRRVSPGAAADHQQPCRVDDQADQPPREGDREVLAPGRSATSRVASFSVPPPLKRMRMLSRVRFSIG